MIGLGTIVNVSAIVLGGCAGLLLRGGLVLVMPLLFGVAAAWIRRNKTHDAKTV